MGDVADCACITDEATAQATITTRPPPPTFASNVAINPHMLILTYVDGGLIGHNMWIQGPERPVSLSILYSCLFFHASDVFCDNSHIMCTL